MITVTPYTYKTSPVSIKVGFQEAKHRDQIVGRITIELRRLNLTGSVMKVMGISWERRKMLFVIPTKYRPVISYQLVGVVDMLTINV